jgi:hypothetical protein
MKNKTAFSYIYKTIFILIFLLCISVNSIFIYGDAYYNRQAISETKIQASSEQEISHGDGSHAVFLPDHLSLISKAQTKNNSHLHTAFYDIINSDYLLIAALSSFLICSELSIGYLTDTMSLVSLKVRLNN